MRVALWIRSSVLPDLSHAASLARLLRWYTPRAISAEWAALGPQEIIAVVERHLSTCHRMRGRRCLRRGLLVFYFLHRAGYPAVLHLGAFHRPQGCALAHCWNSLGELVDDPPRDPIVPMLEWSGASGNQALQRFSTPYGFAANVSSGGSPVASLLNPSNRIVVPTRVDHP